MCFISASKYKKKIFPWKNESNIFQLHKWTIHTTLYRKCCIEYTWLFVNAHCYDVLCISNLKNIFLAFKQLDSMKPIQLLKNIWKLIHIFFICSIWYHENNTTFFINIWKKMCIKVSDFYMKIINNKRILLYIYKSNNTLITTIQQLVWIAHIFCCW